MKIVTLVARVLLALAFIVFGLNGFLHFIPTGPMPAGPAGQFAGSLASTHYMDVVSAIEIVASVLLLIGLYIPLALVLLGPIIVNILIFHLTMAPSTIGPGLIVTILWFVIFSSHRSAFAGIFQAKS